jgi:hypothetical protein
MKLSKYEAREYRKKKLDKSLAGQGLYVYRNTSGGDLMLPKPTSTGQKTILKDAEFQGDSYYMELVRSNQCRLVKEIISPQEEQNMKKQEEEKLIVDQPDIITEAGKVEHVCGGSPTDCKPLNETPSTPGVEQDVLLNDDPMDGIDIIE